MRFSLVNLVALALCIQTANARLFPTQPIAKTVFRGGAWNNVTWRDSESKPSLAEMGEMRLELWVGDSRLLATLETDIDPRKLSQNVFISKELWTNASDFVLLFKSADPPTTIYTADFTITDMDGNRTAFSGDHHGLSTNTNVSTSPAAIAASGGGNNDLVTVTMETTASGATTMPFPEPTSSGIGRVGAIANDASSGRRGLRKANVQFNLVYVFWPALFGLVLAL